METEAGRKSSLFARCLCVADEDDYEVYAMIMDSLEALWRELQGAWVASPEGGQGRSVRSRLYVAIALMRILLFNAKLLSAAQS